jgi:hypothetical protein
MHRKEIAKFQIVIISFIKKRFNRSGVKILFLKNWRKRKKLMAVDEEKCQ